MNELSDWLRTQFNEDDRIAREATPGPWQNAPTARHHATPSGRSEEAVFASPHDRGATVVAITGEAVERQHLVDAEHIARHNPARVLREIDAKRRIVDRYAWLREHGDTGGAAWVLPLLALPYADRPGYREEWRP